MDRNLPRLIIVLIAILVGLIGRFIYWRRMRGSIDWPETQATLQSGEEGFVKQGYTSERLPFFDFSYVVNGEYYSGRFGLRVTEDRTDELLRDLTDTKITIGYDPRHPSVFRLPDELSVEGFRVEVLRDSE